jgi:hypothetical protein
MRGTDVVGPDEVVVAGSDVVLERACESGRS